MHVLIEESFIITEGLKGDTPLSYKENALSIAELIDSYRLVPRLMLIGYAYMIYHSSIWFMSLETPLASQSTFIGIVWGAAAAITGFYNATGRKWK